MLNSGSDSDSRYNRYWEVTAVGMWGRGQVCRLYTSVQCTGAPRFSLSLCIMLLSQIFFTPVFNSFVSSVLFFSYFDCASRLPLVTLPIIY